VCMASVSPGVEIFSGLSEAKDEEFHLVVSHGRWSPYHYLSTHRPQRLEAPRSQLQSRPENPESSFSSAI